MAGNKSKKKKEEDSNRDQMATSEWAKQQALAKSTVKSSDPSRTFPGMGHVLGKKSESLPQENQGRSLTEYMVNELVRHEGFWCELKVLCSAIERSSRGESFTKADIMETILSNPELFNLSTMRDDGGAVNYVRLEVNLKLCTEQAEGRCNEDCTDLHICEGLLSGLCTDQGMCVHCHDIKSHHNREVLANFHLDSIHPSRILALLRCSLPDVYPGPCIAYNRNSCSRAQCNLLHICVQQFGMQNECECPLQHKIMTNKHILGEYGISRSTSEHDILERYVRFWRRMKSMNFHFTGWRAVSRAPQPNFPDGMFGKDDDNEKLEGPGGAGDRDLLRSNRVGERKKTASSSERAHKTVAQMISHKGIRDVDSEDSTADDDSDSSQSVDDVLCTLLPLVSTEALSRKEKRVLRKLIETPKNQNRAGYQQIADLVKDAVVYRQKNSMQMSEMNNDPVEDDGSKSPPVQRKEEKESISDHSDYMDVEHQQSPNTNQEASIASAEEVPQKASAETLRDKKDFSHKDRTSKSEDAVSRSSFKNKRSDMIRSNEEEPPSQPTTGYERRSRRTSFDSQEDITSGIQSLHLTQDDQRQARSDQRRRDDAFPQHKERFDNSEKYTDENQPRNGYGMYYDQRRMDGDRRDGYERREQRQDYSSQHEYSGEDYPEYYQQSRRADWDPHYGDQFYSRNYPRNDQYPYQYNAYHYGQGHEDLSHEREVPVRSQDFQGMNRSRMQQVEQNYDASYQHHNHDPSYQHGSRDVPYQRPDQLTDTLQRLINSGSLSNVDLQTVIQLLEGDKEKAKHSTYGQNSNYSHHQQREKTAAGKQGARPKANSDFRSGSNRNAAQRHPARPGAVNMNICGFHLRKSCDREGCQFLHISRPYGWFVSNTYLGEKISDFLEELFRSNKDTGNLLLSRFETIPTDAQGTLSHCNAWQVDVNTMEIKAKGKTLNLRRASTSSKGARPNDWTATTWRWYFKGDDGTWIPIDSKICENLETTLVSYNKENAPSVCKYKYSGFNYETDVIKLTQLNTDTRKERMLRRRPAPLQDYDNRL